MQLRAIGTAERAYSVDHKNELVFCLEAWWGVGPGSGIAEAGKERNTPGIFKDLGYLPDPDAIWRCPSDTREREGLSLSPFADALGPFFENFSSYGGNFNHHNMGWPTPPFSFPPGGHHVLEIHYQSEIYSPGDVMFAWDATGWQHSIGGNAVDNTMVNIVLWPSIPIFNETTHRHAIDLPNMLFSDGHTVPTDLKNLRDPENWAIEGWDRTRTDH